MTTLYERYVAAQMIEGWSLRMELLSELIIEDPVAYVEAARKWRGAE